MPLTVTGSRPWHARHGLVLLAIFLPIALGMVMLSWQAERTLKQISTQAARDSVQQFDLMLDHAARAASDLLPLAGQDCEPNLFALRDQVTRRPYVRSTNLVRNNTLYCSSLFGDFNEPFNAANYVDGSLWLMGGNPVTPGTALLIYRLAAGDRSALVAIDGFHLSNILRLVSYKTRLIFKVGNHWIASDGKVRDSIAPAFPVADSEAISGRFAYSVEGGFPSGEVWRYMKAEYPLLFGLLIVLGALAGASTRWIQQRASSPSHELQRALEAKEFVPYFQPVVRGDDESWAGAEVLMRWQHPREGLVRPDLFIPFAERSGLIMPMTRALMQQTAKLLAPHADKLVPGFHLGINITAGHCQELGLVEDCRELLAAFKPGQITLVLELTERELISPSAVTHQLFSELHDLGVMIAIDDFGTGHSSLNYLSTLNVDYLKIDQSFVAMIGDDVLSRHILDSIIELCSKLDLGIVAEGVETREQRDYLLARKVDFLQGYLIGRPMPAADFLKCLGAP